MMHMIRTQGNARDIIQEVNLLHGKQYIPDDVKRRLNLFIGLADLKDKEKVVDPFIPGLNLNYETLLDKCRRKKGMDQSEGGGGDEQSSPGPPPYLSKNRLV